MRTVHLKLHLMLEPSPDSVRHHQQLARAYLRGKGISVDGEGTDITDPVWIEIVDDLA